jgi:predicted transposase YbfD/YdcC
VNGYEKSNEITAIPELIKQIDVRGAIVTIDAAGCQKNIAKDIVDGGGDYVLARKGNQGNLPRAVEAYVVEHAADNFARVEARRYEEKEKKHGRTEHRTYWQTENTLHWSLDMTFREDESRIRDRHVAENLAWLRKIALSLYKQHPGKQSLVMKRRMAGWSQDFLMQLLTGKPS